MSNIYKETYIQPQNYPITSKSVRTKNMEIPQGSKKTKENQDRKYQVKDDNKLGWHISNSKRSRNCNISNISPRITEVLNKGKVDLHKKEINEIYGFAIKLEDKVLLYDKDPRLRVMLGSRIRNSNKFECLRNSILYENKVFKEI